MQASPSVRNEVSGDGYARGWYLVRWSRDLSPGQVAPLRYMARDFVLYRGEDGHAVLLDGHCPHRGAHLGHGGCVRGTSVVCPFHGWRFNRGGQCVEIPHAATIPAGASVRSYTVVEHSGMILAYLGPSGTSPEYTVPEIEELGTGWTPLDCSEREVATRPREVLENVADVAHFGPVHHQDVQEFEMTLDGPRATQRMRGTSQNLSGKRIAVQSVATYHGPGVQFTRLSWAYDMVLINAHVPIDDTRLVLRFGVSLRLGAKPVPQKVVDRHVAAARDGYFDDVAIWEHKRWRDTPALADGDGPIMKLRKWYSTFLDAPPVKA